MNKKDISYLNNEQYKILRDGIQPGELYNDQRFGHTNKAVFHTKIDYAKPPLIHSWYRPTDIVQFPLFYQQFKPIRDRQGRESGHVFSAAVAMLSRDASKLKWVCPDYHLDSFEDNRYRGIFRFNICKFGSWYQVIIDDLLPVDENRNLIFSRCPHKTEFWVPLLEKAYAKIIGDFECIKFLRMCDVLSDFTGGVSEVIDVNDYRKSTEEELIKQFTKFTDLNDNRAMMAAVIKCEKEEIDTFSENGVIMGRYYPIVEIKKIDIKKAKIAGTDETVFNLVCLRSPHSNGLYQGTWSNTAIFYQSIPLELKNKFQLQPRNDNEFWMTFKQFIMEFDTLHVSHQVGYNLIHKRVGLYHHEVHGVWRHKQLGFDLDVVKIKKKKILENELLAQDHKDTAKFRALLLNQQYCFDVNSVLDKPTPVGIALLQREVKHYAHPHDRQHIQFFLFKVEDNRNMRMDTVDHAYQHESKCSSARSIYEEIHLLPGRYVVIPSTKNVCNYPEFKLRILTPFRSKLILLEKYDPTEFRLMRRIMKKHTTVFTVYGGKNLKTLDENPQTFISRLVRAVSLSSIFSNANSKPKQKNKKKKRKDVKGTFNVSSMYSSLMGSGKKHNKSKHSESVLDISKYSKKSSSANDAIASKKQKKKTKKSISFIEDEKLQHTKSDSDILKLIRSKILKEKLKEKSHSLESNLNTNIIPSKSNSQKKDVHRLKSINSIDTTSRRKRISFTNMARAVPDISKHTLKHKFKDYVSKDGKKLDKHIIDNDDEFCSTYEQYDISNKLGNISRNNVVDIVNSKTSTTDSNDSDDDPTDYNKLITSDTNLSNIKELMEQIELVSDSKHDVNELRNTPFAEKENDADDIISSSDEENICLTAGTNFNRMGGPDYSGCTSSKSRISLRRRWRSKKCLEANKMLYSDEAQLLNSGNSTEESIAERKPRQLLKVRNTHIVRPSDSNASMDDSDDGDYEKSVLIDTKEQLLLEPANTAPDVTSDLKSILKKSQSKYNERRRQPSKTKEMNSTKSKAALKRERFDERHFKLKVMRRTGMSEIDFNNQSKLDLDVLRSKYAKKNRRAKKANDSDDIELQTQSLDSSSDSSARSLYSDDDDSKHFRNNSVYMMGPYTKAGLRKNKKKEEKYRRKMKKLSKQFEKNKKHNRLEGTGETNLEYSKSANFKRIVDSPSDIYISELTGLAAMVDLDLNQNNSAKVTGSTRPYYVVVKCAGKKYRSKCVTAGANPLWDFNTLIHRRKPNKSQISVKVWAKNSLFKDDFIGKTTIKIADEQSKEHNKKFKSRLYGKKGEKTDSVSGHLIFQLKYKNSKK